MTENRVIRLAVTGTYSCGKTTTAEALSIATGIPRTHALTAREILRELVPGKTLEELSASELIMLGLRRLEERIHAEAAQPGSFVSDGSVLHEWVYGEARLRIGINPSAGRMFRTLVAAAGVPQRRFYRRYMDAYGTIVQKRAKRLYDACVHLPVEFDMTADGHRPVSEPFRRLSDRLIIETIEKIGMIYHVVGGTVRERVERIIEIHRLPIVVPVADAIEIATVRVGEATTALNEHVRRLAAARTPAIKDLWP